MTETEQKLLERSVVIQSSCSLDDSICEECGQFCESDAYTCESCASERPWRSRWKSQQTKH